MKMEKLAVVRLVALCLVLCAHPALYAANTTVSNTAASNTAALSAPEAPHEVAPQQIGLEINPNGLTPSLFLEDSCWKIDAAPGSRSIGNPCATQSPLDIVDQIESQPVVMDRL